MTAALKGALYEIAAIGFRAWLVGRPFQA